MLHSINISPHDFTRIVIDQTKTFVVCDLRDDAQFDDEIELIEFDDEPITKTGNEPKGPTGNSKIYRAGFIKKFAGSVIVSLLPVKESKRVKVPNARKT